MTRGTRWPERQTGTSPANYNSFGFRAVVPKPYGLEQLGGTISAVLSAPL